MHLDVDRSLSFEEAIHAQQTSVRRERVRQQDSGPSGQLVSFPRFRWVADALKFVIASEIIFNLQGTIKTGLWTYVVVTYAPAQVELCITVVTF